MEGPPRLAERGRRRFKPQTVLWRQMPAVGFESHLAKPVTSGFAATSRQRLEHLLRSKAASSQPRALRKTVLLKTSV